MPISRNFVVPASAKQLRLPDAASKAFVIFISSEDPETKQPWCPDVRASWPHIQAAFGGENAPTVSVVEVGQRPEWRSPENVFRKNWNVNGVPTLAKYERVHGEIVETARLDESGIMDEAQLRGFIG
ncbi:uncharacterized protein MAM_00608 [Metarhizium album ARSEF 1941]|uniref:Thioredoxin domain-containing protein n=1 Tax=Metarhizium album (strain ARSEF 1941) TaxID=1081103 RepID=A0A0B2WZ84_METAS|nr:uncharacterized protein MAM_00608 [Metarhizium album ARSEF 1941]KHO01607.1 hypothetical protein MAM_00608 [Metarhizium album ARSEF 1941]